MKRQKEGKRMPKEEPVCPGCKKPLQKIKLQETTYLAWSQEKSKYEYDDSDSYDGYQCTHCDYQVGDEVEGLT